MDILFEVGQPFLVFIQDRKHSLSRFVLVVELDGSEADRLMGKDACTKLPRSCKVYFFLSMEGVSLGLEQSRTPL